MERDRRAGRLPVSSDVPVSPPAISADEARQAAERLRLSEDILNQSLIRGALADLGRGKAR